jgi:hypothetical protein
MDQYLHDYVWMKPSDGGAPVRVSTEGDEISQKMWQGWAQCDPPTTGEGE